MSNELYQQIEIASKFQPEPSKPSVEQAEQAKVGLDWASRQAQRPQPEPVVPMRPIQPVAS